MLVVKCMYTARCQLVVAHFVRISRARKQTRDSKHSGCTGLRWDDVVGESWTTRVLCTPWESPSCVRCRRHCSDTQNRYYYRRRIFVSSARSGSRQQVVTNNDDVEMSNAPADVFKIWEATGQMGKNAKINCCGFEGQEKVPVPRMFEGNEYIVSFWWNIWTVLCNARFPSVVVN